MTPALVADAAARFDAVLRGGRGTGRRSRAPYTLAAMDATTRFELYACDEYLRLTERSRLGDGVAEVLLGDTDWLRTQLAAAVAGTLEKSASTEVGDVHVYVARYDQPDKFSISLTTPDALVHHPLWKDHLPPLLAALTPDAQTLIA